MKRLAVSNIAWDVSEEEEILGFLRSAGVSQLEVAPTKFWPDWKGADVASAAVERDRLEHLGFTSAAFQAIFFGKTEIKIFRSKEDRAEALEHLELVASLAEGMGVRYLVFGSPGVRDRGDLDEQSAFLVARTFFEEAAEICAGFGTVLCLEPNPPDYNCNFVTRWKEAEEMVRAVDHRGLRLQLDTACIQMAGDDPAEAIRKCADIVGHFHISEPKLADFCAPAVDHAAAALALKACGYEGSLSIEMRRSENPLASVIEAVEKVRSWYF